MKREGIRYVVILERDVEEGCWTVFYVDHRWKADSQKGVNSRVGGKCKRVVEFWG